jgi:hypothetical protein
MSDADGLKSLNPSPHRVAARTLQRSVDQKPWLLAVANLVVGLFVCFVSVGALGGYALEHPAHHTAGTARLEIVGTLLAVITASASVLSLAIRPTWSKRVNLVALLIIWPLELILVWVLWMMLF